MIKKVKERLKNREYLLRLSSKILEKHPELYNNNKKREGKMNIVKMIESSDVSVEAKKLADKFDECSTLREFRNALEDGQFLSNQGIHSEELVNELYGLCIDMEMLAAGFCADCG